MKFQLIIWLFGLFLVICAHGEAISKSTENADGEEAEEGEEETGGDEKEGDEMEGDEGDDAEAETDDTGDMDDVMDTLAPLSTEQLQELHKKMDANSNGKVSLSEVTDFAHQMRRAVAKLELDDVMKEKDKNKDNKLDFQEFLEDPGKHSEDRQAEMQTEFRELDVDGDKFLDHDELASLYHHHANEKVEHTLSKVAFADKDTNKDGKISLAEFYVHLQQEGEDDDKEAISADDKDVFNKLDMDSSGSLTLNELTAWETGAYQAEDAVRKLFKLADKDKDSSITFAELDNAKQELSDDTDYDAQMYLHQWADHQKREKGEL